MPSGWHHRLVRLFTLTYHEGPVATWRSASRHTVRQHLQLLGAGWRPRGDRIVNGKAWLPLDPQWQIAVWVASLGQAGFAFENVGPDEFMIVAPDGSKFVTGPTELMDLLGAVHERFVQREYDMLDVQGAVVIDIGAYVGDSAIFFACAGARKVYGYEPFEATFAAAGRNVQLNGLQSVIELRRVGLGAEAKTMAGVLVRDAPMLSSTTGAFGTGPSNFKGTVEPVHLVTLASVVKGVRAENPDSRLICKMDCEGAEFDVLTDVSVPALRELDQLLVEYHYRSPDPICRVLQEAGLTATCLEDRLRVEADGPVGMILANRTSTGARARP